MSTLRLRCRSKSAGCEAERPMLEQELSDGDSDREIYIPGRKDIYITTTKKGKPAFGRKKPARLLEDMGFDAIAQALGLASRIDIEREGQRRKLSSQSSHPTTPSTTARRFTPRPRLSSRRLSSGHDVPHLLPLKGNHRYISASPAVQSGQSGDSPQVGYNDSRVLGTQELTPPTFNLPAQPTQITPSQTHPPPPAIWNTQAFNNGMVATAAPNQAYYSLPTSPVGPMPSPGFPTPQHQQQPIIYHQYHPPAVWSEPNTPTYPIQGFTTLNPHSPVAPVTPVSFPPNCQRHDCSQPAANQPIVFSPVEARGFEEHYKAMIEAQNAAEKDAEKEEDEEKAEDIEDIGSQLHHFHFCAGCGKIRSRQYQEEHPLEIGQIPKRAYCSRCHSEATQIERENTTIVNEEHVPTTVDALHVTHDDGQKRKKTGIGYRWLGKSRRFSLFSNKTFNSATSDDDTQVIQSLSTVEESEAEPSAPVPRSTPRRDQCRRMTPSSRGNMYKNEDDDSSSGLEVVKRRRRVSSQGSKRPVPRKGSGARHSSAYSKSRNFTRSTSSPEQNGPLDRSKRTGSRKSSTPRTPKRGSKIELPISPKSRSRVRPKVTVESVSDVSQASIKKYDLQDEVSKAVNKAFEDLNLRSEKQVLDPIDSNAPQPRNNYRARQPSCGSSRSSRDNEYPWEHIPKLRTRGPEENLRSRARAGSETTTRGSVSDRREHSDRRRVRRHQDGA
ncbi:hypothetical protein M426DRAFT_12935 [Hypoxylon sp. CI-4A]|nr:hypothetical protein M426DRAFT_12935 [Hypoxylon sp. CI-4A]